MVSVNELIHSNKAATPEEIKEINERLEYEDRDNGLFFSTEKYTPEKLKEMCDQINKIDCLKAMMREEHCFTQLIVSKNRGFK